CMSPCGSVRRSSLLPSAADDTSANPAAATATASSAKEETSVSLIDGDPFNYVAGCQRRAFQQTIELGPHFVLLGARLMAECPLILRPQLGRRGFRLVMSEGVVSPSAAGLGVPLGVLDGHVGAVEGPRKVPPPRRLRERA